MLQLCHSERFATPADLKPCERVWYIEPTGGPPTRHEFADGSFSWAYPVRIIGWSRA
jgi:hypothetical protein